MTGSEVAQFQARGRIWLKDSTNALGIEIIEVYLRYPCLLWPHCLEGRGPGNSFDSDPVLPQNIADRGLVGPSGRILFGLAPKEELLPSSHD